MSVTVLDAIERIVSRLPVRLPPGGCDRIIRGDPASEVHGIAVTFLASRSVLTRAAAVGANFVITHEPTYYNHHDHTEWLGDDMVLADKQRIIDRAGLVVWRLHDHVHQGWPDTIAVGMLEALDWRAFVLPDRPHIIEFPAKTLRAVAAHVRERLGASAVRVAGDLDAAIRRVAFLPGACGGQRQIEHLAIADVDAVFCGESAEWETCEYVRDAVDGGKPKALIVCGHALSEEAGMVHVADHVRAWFPEVPVVHLPTGDPFTLIT